ncbi:hypothetical protein KKC1_28040 [Calderihabitans maritimus]|uniref:Uncharacterized protein n=1 Tax=Calderihabitans maritimus TaxID=1246530 RepID=A0A1Z5HVW0_9FIRM|nr:hypothetical protein KKC1_28040 [Calderihabitans maritimus]
MAGWEKSIEVLLQERIRRRRKQSEGGFINGDKTKPDSAVR